MIAIGRLTKPHGLRGEVVFLPYVDDMDVLPDLHHCPVYLRHPQAEEQRWTIVSWRRMNKRILMRLGDCQTIEQAERLRDYEIFIPRQSFPPLPEGEFYWFDIEGLQVYNSDGELLGTIADIIYTGSNDVYVVRDEEQDEHLVPALQNVVRRIDLKRGEMHLFSVPGLLD